MVQGRPRRRHRELHHGPLVHHGGRHRFAAADPGHVLPSCIIGSALAGALSAAFGCTSPAPHGGAWVIAVIGNPVGYLAALAIGSIVACLILSLWKKPYQEA